MRYSACVFLRSCSFVPLPRPSISPLFPYTTLFRSKHSVDRFVIVSIFIPKLRLILILNSFLGSSDSLGMKIDRKSGSAGMAETDLVCRLLLEKKKPQIEDLINTIKPYIDGPEKPHL